MSTRRCPSCKIAYPASILRCRVCDGSLAWDGMAMPDADWQERAAALLGMASREQEIRWRLEQYVRLGFPVEEAEMLACRRDVDWHQAAWLIHHGCDHELVLRIVG